MNCKTWFSSPDLIQCLGQIAALKLWADSQIRVVIDPYFFFVCFRKADRTAEDGGKLEQAPKHDDIFDASAGSKVDDVDILISQMHDLSFMLESKLSVPQS